jgi:hypothetical protein
MLLLKKDQNERRRIFDVLLNDLLRKKANENRISLPKQKKKKEKQQQQIDVKNKIK